jgi:hypothetical protein
LPDGELVPVQLISKYWSLNNFWVDKVNVLFFSIGCVNRKYMTNHFYFTDKEKEISLKPGSYFDVIGQLNSGSKLHQNSI